MKEAQETGRPTRGAFRRKCERRGLEVKDEGASGRSVRMRTRTRVVLLGFFYATRQRQVRSPKKL